MNLSFRFQNLSLFAKLALGAFLLFFVFALGTISNNHDRAERAKYASTYQASEAGNPSNWAKMTTAEKSEAVNKYNQEIEQRYVAFKIQRNAQLQSYATYGRYPYTAEAAGWTMGNASSSMGKGWDAMSDAEKWMIWSDHQRWLKGTGAWLQARGYKTLQDAIDAGETPPIGQ